MASQHQPSGNAVFDGLGPVRHALYNGCISSPEQLSRWTPDSLQRRLGIRSNQICKLEAFLHDFGLTLADNAGERPGQSQPIAAAQWRL